MGKKSKWDLSTADVESLLRQRYCNRQEWALAWEVGNTTGGARRRCDLLAMHCWASNGGHKLHGHEIKVSRADWLKEMNDISKAEEFAKRCHYFWIAAPKGMIPLEELPTQWGLMQATDKTLKVAKPASLRMPEQMDWRFFASIMRTAVNQAPSTHLLEKVERQAYENGAKAAKAHRDNHRQHEERRESRELARLQNNVAAFEKVSGIKIDNYNGGTIGEAVKLLRQLGVPGVFDRLDRLAADLDNVRKFRDEQEEKQAEAEAEIGRQQAKAKAAATESAKQRDLFASQGN